MVSVFVFRGFGYPSFFTFYFSLVMRRFVAFCVCFLWCMSSVWAGNDDYMRSTGKIYTVVGVIGLVFVGIVLFLVVLERRVAKLERKK